MELAYSIHLGSDKNRTKQAKKIAKDNPSETTSFSNNGIQNARQLSKVNKHNLRDYDKNREKIFVTCGTYDLYKDVQDLYLREFEESRIEYNNKQIREDRKIRDYFKHISDSKLWDLACEFIIELGDIDFWKNKDMDYKMKMCDVYNEQVKDLMKIVPEFKVANAVIHFDESSPHMHIVGIPVKDNNKKGMKKQVAKSKIFTKESLTKIQSEMRKCCIRSFNKFYKTEMEIKKKQKGRNKDINVKDMADYKSFKGEFERNSKKLEEVNKNTEELNTSAKSINTMLSNLKTVPFNKDNRVISSENVEIIKNYINLVTDTTKSIKTVNKLNILAKEIEQEYDKTYDNNFSLKFALKQKEEEIENLKEKLSFKDKIIDKLENEKEKLQTTLNKFKNFWHNLMKHFQNKVSYEKDKNYKAVADDLSKEKIFDNNETEIVNDLSRKVKTIDEISRKSKDSNVR